MNRSASGAPCPSGCSSSAHSDGSCPRRLAVVAPVAAERPARQLFARIPLALAGVNEAVRFRSAASAGGGVRARGTAWWDPWRRSSTRRRRDRSPTRTSARRPSSAARRRVPGRRPRRAPAARCRSTACRCRAWSLSAIRGPAAPTSRGETRSRISRRRRRQARHWPAPACTQAGRCPSPRDDPASPRGGRRTRVPTWWCSPSSRSRATRRRISCCGPGFIRAARGRGREVARDSAGSRRSSASRISSRDLHKDVRSCRRLGQGGVRQALSAQLRRVRRRSLLRTGPRASLLEHGEIWWGRRSARTCGSPARPRPTSRWPARNYSSTSRRRPSTS